MSGSKTSEPSFNLFPFASMAGGWLGPLVLFWLYVWGPLRPFDYPAEHVAPSGAALLLTLLVCVAPWWLPASYYRPRPIEESGRLYEALGIRYFRFVAPMETWQIAGIGGETQRIGSSEIATWRRSSSVEPA